MTIKARATRFDLTDTPSHWVPGHPYATHTLDTMHAVLPPAERWFVDVYRDALPYVTDDTLRDDVLGFIAQETTHARAHDRGLEHLARHGIDVRREVAWADRARERLRARGKRLPASVQRRLLHAELAAIAAGEHYTAFLGDWILDSPQLDLIGIDPVMLDLLRWHGAEEVEHRSVAFDLYQHVHGGYATTSAATTTRRTWDRPTPRWPTSRRHEASSSGEPSDPDRDGTITARPAGSHGPRWSATVRSERRSTRGAVMLEMRTVCERCDVALDEVSDARICSFECTFCPACGDELAGTCPNCSGELVHRPRRAAKADLAS